MIGAVSIELYNNCSIKLYLVGTYDDIDWESGKPSELGKGFLSYCYKNGHEPDKRGIIVTPGFDGVNVLRLVETRKYIFRAEKNNKERIDDGEIESLFKLNNDGKRVIRFQNEENKFLKQNWDRYSVTIQFVNYLGRSKITFGNLHDAIVFEVIPDKFSYEDDYINLTKALADECAELLLDYAGPTSNVFSLSETNSRTLLEQFIFLRKFCFGDNLQELFEIIKRNPDRVLDQESEMKPIGLGIPSQKFYSNPFSYSRGWTKLSGENDGYNVYLPQMVSVTRKHEKLDTPANRFIKYAFQRFDSLCSDLSDSLNIDQAGMQSECKKEAEVIHKSLESIFKDSFFDEIGNLEIMPQNNQVLQKREGYSQVFLAFSMLELALQLDWKGIEDIYEGESKNVALLYEYWLFFELYKIISSIEGCVTDYSKKDSILDFTNGITVSLEEGEESFQAFEIRSRNIKINLYYNRTFNHKPFVATKYEGSYSRAFRPDYTLAIFPNSYKDGAYNGEDKALKDGAVCFIHFDAKYRITDLTALFDSGDQESVKKELDEEKIDSVVNTYKRGDLLKMHTYNNAIRRTVGSYVLYPGTNNDGRHNDPFHIYDEILPGVGAFAIKPSNSDLGEKVIQDFILKAIEIWSNEYSTFNRFRRYSELIIKSNVGDNDAGLSISDSSDM